MTVWNDIKLSRPIQTFITVINYGHKAWVDNGADPPYYAMFNIWMVSQYGCLSVLANNYADWVYIASQCGLNVHMHGCLSAYTVGLCSLFPGSQSTDNNVCGHYTLLHVTLGKSINEKNLHREPSHCECVGSWISGGTLGNDFKDTALESAPAIWVKMRNIVWEI